MESVVISGTDLKIVQTSLLLTLDQLRRERHGAFIAAGGDFKSESVHGSDLAIRDVQKVLRVVGVPDDLIT